MPNNDEKLVLPKPTPERVDDGGEDWKNADSDGDSALDDLVIYVDEDEVKAENERDPRKKH
jgi:hypothetical protein